jgi:hypothetical protein
MSSIRRLTAAIAAAAVLALAPLAVGCGAGAPSSGSGGPSVAVGSDSGDDGLGTAQPEGTEDPSQQTRADGVVATFGGPSQGDSATDVVDAQTECKTIAVFWGSEVPAGIAYTIDGAIGADVSSGAPVEVPGLRVDHGPCGSQDAADCLGLTIDDLGAPGACSLVVRIGAGFREGTALLLTGTLTCTAATDCATVRARVADQGPAVFVCDPSWLQAGRTCDAETWEG